jgi:hypothetical protein
MGPIWLILGVFDNGLYTVPNLCLVQWENDDAVFSLDGLQPAAVT